MHNSGYIGKVRSVRSQNSIDNFIVPLGMINYHILNQFRRSAKQQYSNNIFRFKVQVWKYVAKLIGSNVFHHTGSDFRLTKHYNLWKVADYLNRNYQSVRDDYLSQKSRSVHLALIYIKKYRKNGSCKYRAVYGFMKKNILTEYGSKKQYNVLSKNVYTSLQLPNLHDFKNYLLVSEGIKINDKKFVNFLSKNHVYYGNTAICNNINYMEFSISLEKMANEFKSA